MVLGRKYATSFVNQLSNARAEGTFTFDINGETFTGLATATGLSEMQIKDGRIDGNEIIFTVVATSPAGKSTVKATIDGDKISGTIDMGMGRPITPFEGKKID